MECIYRRHLLFYFKSSWCCFGILYCLKVGPAWFFAPDVGPFCMKTSNIGKFTRSDWFGVLALLVGYGLLEFIGTFCRPIMRPLWKTPGRSAIDAVASFVGSYSLALLITNRVYKEGKYTTKEALSLQAFLQYPQHL